MGSTVYRALLHLLPRRLRARYGDAMSETFADLRATVRRDRGTAAVAILWMKETAGLARFAARERIAGPDGASLRTSRRGPRLSSELHWAWRGVRARGWRGTLIVALLAVTLAANAIIFSVADALVFHPYPFPDTDRVVSLVPGSDGRIDRPHAARLLDEWSTQRDLLIGVSAYLQKGGVFLVGPGPLERMSVADVTVGLLDVLSARPRWGRAFTRADLEVTGGYSALISEDLARQKFGRPELAPGRRLEATGGALAIVGVMPVGFAFPDTRTSVWRLMDLAGPLATNFGAPSLMARLAPGFSVDSIARPLADRATSVGLAAGVAPYRVTAKPFFVSKTAGALRTQLFVLLGAALSLLLATCANIASLELAQAVQRARGHAVQLALGASRQLLFRVTVFEGAMMIVAGLALGLVLSQLALRIGLQYLPDAMQMRAPRPIRLDARVVIFAALAATLTWVLASVVPSLAAASSRLLPALAVGGRLTLSSRRSLLFRRALTVVEVALAVALVVGGLLYARSYAALLRVEKGFDSRGVAVVGIQMPPTYLATQGGRNAFNTRAAAELGSIPGLLALTFSSPPPATGDSPSPTVIETDTGTTSSSQIYLGRKWVDASYFSVTRLPLRSGRYLRADDPDTNVVVTDMFARRFWPDTAAVGRAFRGSPSSPYAHWMTVVGVVGDFRTVATRMPDLNDRDVFAYTMTAPPKVSAAPPSPRAAAVDTGGATAFFDATVRLENPARAGDVAAALRRIDPHLPVTVELVDEIYAQQNAGTLLAARVVGIFSVIAFVVAMAGLYGVMAFLVASRTREIGIRMALGADRGAISRMILTSSGWLVLTGVGLGAATAFVVARSLSSQLFGVSAADSVTYFLVAGTVLLTAFVATWQPARQAAGTQPAVTLRSE